MLRVERSIWTYIVDNPNLERLEEGLQQRNYKADVTHFPPGDHRGYLGEFPGTFTYRQRYEEGDLYSKAEVCGVNTTPAALEHLKGNEWEYDYGQDIAKSLLVLLPC